MTEKGTAQAKETFNEEHRDTQAIHAKLDEILHALGDTRNEITGWMKRNPRRSNDAENTCAKTTKNDGRRQGRVRRELEAVEGLGGARGARWFTRELNTPSAPD